MTVYAKTIPVGIDRNIKRFQDELDKLWDNVDVYGKLYINVRNGKKVAEAYVGNGEYKEVFTNDRKAAVFGFFVGDTRHGHNIIHALIELVCSCNLNSLYGTTERNDEETMLKVLKIVEENTLFPNEKTIKTGLGNVFSRVSIDPIRFRDMQPWFNFSITFNINYKNEI